jgi:hypothetical protein
MTKKKGPAPPVEQDHYFFWKAQSFHHRFEHGFQNIVEHKKTDLLRGNLLVFD